MEENKELYLMIENIMSAKGISQADIARELDVNRADICLTLKNLKEGKSITTKKLFSLFRVLKISFALNVK